MFPLSRGELAIVLFILALVWGAGVLPRLGERVAVWFATRSPTGGPKPDAPAGPAHRGPGTAAGRDEG